MKDTLSGVMGGGVTLVDSAIETAKKVQRTLHKLRLGNDRKEKPVREFYVTDSPDRFVRVGERFLGKKIEHIEKVEVGG